MQLAHPLFQLTLPRRKAFISGGTPFKPLQITISLFDEIGQLFQHIVHPVLPCAMHLLKLHVRRVHLPQHTWIFLLDLANHIIQQCPAKLLVQGLQIVDFEQRVNIKTIGTSARSATVQVVPHVQDQPQELLNARGILEDVRDAAEVHSRLCEPRVDGLEPAKEAPDLDAQRILRNRSQHEHKVLSSVPRLIIAWRSIQSSLEHCHLLFRGQIARQQLHIVWAQERIIHLGDGVRQQLSTRQQRNHAPDLPSSLLLKKTPYVWGRVGTSTWRGQGWSATF
mmetsp:Transcript_40186/g.70719  ORF Transcript_40186/g.70719 Transcript_40186/m.70719 type:complete len:280 (-) Transcript_40186:57-896(-)